MPLGTQIDLGPDDGWMKMPLGTEVDLGPGHTVLDGVPAAPAKGAQQLPNFRPMTIVAKGSPVSATAEHLSYIQGATIGIRYFFRYVRTVRVFYFGM